MAVQDKFKQNISVIYFISLLIVSGLVLSIGFENTILDNHAFRQTQTALTTYYFVHEGFRIDYITPVLGEPWSIPFEFPTYQYMVAFIAKTSGIPLDQAGRLVSIFFFYLTLIPLYLLLGHLRIEKRLRLYILGFVLINPILLFWSRTFMIESTVLFLSMMFLWLSIGYIYGDKSLLIPLIIFGALAAVTKVTTWVVFLLPVFFSVINKHRPWKENFKNIEIGKMVKDGVALLGVPIIALFSWTAYAASLRQQNPVASKIINMENLNHYNFGDFSDRFSIKVWSRVFFRQFGENLSQYTIYQVLFVAVLIVVALVLIYLIKQNKMTQYQKIALLSFITFLWGPLVFNHLYYVHGYYLYENSIFLSIALGFFFLSLFAEFKSKYAKKMAALVLILVLIFSVSFYIFKYYPVQKVNKTDLLIVTNKIKKNSDPEDVILVLGSGWGSDIAYYSERKTITSPLSEKDLEELIISKGYMNDRIRGMVLKKDSASIPKAHISRLAHHLKLDGTPVTLTIKNFPEFEMYFKNRDKTILSAHRHRN